MKSLLRALLFLAICIVPEAVSRARDFHRGTTATVKPALPTKEEPISKAAIEKTIEHMLEISKEQKQEIADGKAENAKLQTALNAGTQQIGVMEKYQQDLKQWGLDQYDRAEKEKARGDKEAKESNRRGNFIGWLGAALAFALAWKLVGGFTMAPVAQWSILAGAATAGYFGARLLI